MTRWFRMYTDVLDDPKVQKLPPVLFKTWVNLLCLASRNDGQLPSPEDIAFALRMDESDCAGQVQELLLRGLLDAGEGLAPHNWDARQFKSDKDTTAAERKRAQRSRERDLPSPADQHVTRDTPPNVTRDVTDVSHPPEQSRTESEQTQSRAEQTDDRAAACVEIGKRVTDLMGVTNDPRWLGNWSTVSVWLSQGFDPDLDILPTVAATVERLKRTGKAMPGSLKYFSRAIEENHKARQATGESPAQRSTKEFYSAKKGSAQHRAWLDYYRSQGRRMTFYESQDTLTVPTEYPPQEQAA